MREKERKKNEITKNNFDMNCSFVRGGGGGEGERGRRGGGERGRRGGERGYEGTGVKCEEKVGDSKRRMRTRDRRGEQYRGLVGGDG